MQNAADGHCHFKKTNAIIFGREYTPSIRRSAFRDDDALRRRPLAITIDDRLPVAEHFSTHTDDVTQPDAAHITPP